MSSTSSPNGAWIVGQKISVSTIRSRDASTSGAIPVPFAGEVYTIRGIQLGADPTTGHRDVGFRLAEMFNPRNADGNESGFFHTRFIPWLDADATRIFATEQRELQNAT